MLNPQAKGKCPICKKYFISYKTNKGRNTVFCSRKCANQRPNSSRFIEILQKVPCKTCGKMIKPYRNASSYRKYCSWKCWDKKQENNPNWKGGRTSAIQYIRKAKIYKEFMKWIKIRDNFTCQACGKIGGILHVHHFFPLRLFPQWALSEDNCKTLCIKCHMAFDPYIRNFYAQKT